MWGQNKSIKIKSLINQVMSKVGLGMPEFGKIKMRKDEAKKMSPSILKVTKTYNWRPKINLSKGLTKQLIITEETNKKSTTYDKYLSIRC